MFERGAEEEEFALLRGARVMQADYEQLIADHSWLPTLADGKPDRPAIDRWLLHNVAVVSKAQLPPNRVNTRIEMRPAERRNGARFRGPGAVTKAGGIPRNRETPGYVRSVLERWMNYAN